VLTAVGQQSGKPPTFQRGWKWDGAVNIYVLYCSSHIFVRNLAEENYGGQKRGAAGGEIETPKASRGNGMGRGFPHPLQSNRGS